MATLKITVSTKTTGEIKAHEIFEMDDDTARLFMEQFDKMLAGLAKPIRVVKTVTPEGVTTIDIMACPALPPLIVSPTFEEMYRRALPPPQEGDPV